MLMQRTMNFPQGAWKTAGAGGRRSAILLVLFSISALSAPAQDLKTQPTPFSVWLDFQKLATPGAARSSFPIWLESFQSQSKKSFDGKVAKTTFRLRFRKLGALNEELLLRIFFDDQVAAHPAVAAWSELGEQLFASKPLGDGLGLPTSESLAIPMRGVDYIDIETPGDGANVTGAFLTSLQTALVKHAVDFDAPAPLADPFQNPPATQTGDDVFLFGRVKATLAAEPVKLSPADAPAVTFDFELDAQPEIAVVSFEILNVDVTAPPLVSVNDHALGASAPLMPDLADPAYQPSVRPMDADVRFHYAGWLKCQKAIPGSALRSGSNQLVIQLNGRSASVAIRAIEVQIKQP